MPHQLDLDRIALLLKNAAITDCHTGLLAATIARLLNAQSLFEGYRAAFQHQQNGLHGVHQLCAEDVGGLRYRILIAPADAPISIGGVEANKHFAEPLGIVRPTEGGEE